MGSFFMMLIWLVFMFCIGGFENPDKKWIRQHKKIEEACEYQKQQMDEWYYPYADFSECTVSKIYYAVKYENNEELRDEALALLKASADEDGCVPNGDLSLWVPGCENLKTHVRHTYSADTQFSDSTLGTMLLAERKKFNPYMFDGYGAIKCLELRGKKYPDQIEELKAKIARVAYIQELFDRNGLPFTLVYVDDCRFGVENIAKHTDKLKPEDIVLARNLKPEDVIYGGHFYFKELIDLDRKVMNWR